MYIHQRNNWTQFEWDKEQLFELLASVRHLQGNLVGRMQTLGFDLQDEALLETLTEDVVKSNEIEGEVLSRQHVRSSVARRLGLDVGGVLHNERTIEGLVDMLFDATQHYQKPLTAERLKAWQAAMFPSGRSGMYKVITGDWRDDSTGAMQVVSGAWGRERVHFEAPTAARIEQEMQLFFDWFNQKSGEDAVIKAGIAHLWFVTIHPFEDGNGRIARTITDMQLAKSDGLPQRYYSMSAQINLERKAYYSILEQTQKGDADISDWLEWFLHCLKNALLASNTVLEKVVRKHRFWTRHQQLIFNARQQLLLNKLLDGFEGKLTSSKWGRIAKCSPDTALRDIQDLMQKGVLQKSVGGGRSTSYELQL